MGGLDPLNTLPLYYIINAVEYGPAIVNAVGTREQVTVTHTANTSAAGSASGTLYYFVADEKDGAESA